MAALAPTAGFEVQGPDTLRPKGVFMRRSPSTFLGLSVTQSSISDTPMKISTGPPRLGSASSALVRQEALRMSSRLVGVTVVMRLGTTMKLIGFVWNFLE